MTFRSDAAVSHDASLSSQPRRMPRLVFQTLMKQHHTVRSFFQKERLKEIFITRPKFSMRVYRRLFKYFRPYPLQTVAALTLTIPIAGLDAGMALALKPYIDGMQLNHAQFNPLQAPIIIVSFTFLQGILNYFSSYINGWLGAKVMCDLRRDLFTKLQSMDIAYFDTTTSGNVVQGYFRDPESVNINIINQQKSLIVTVFSSIFLIATLISISWQLSLIAVSVLTLVMLPSTRIRKMIKSLAAQTTYSNSDLMSTYTETYSGIRTIHGYNYQDMQMTKLERWQKMLFDQTVAVAKMQGRLSPVMSVIASVGIALVIWRGSEMVVHHELTTGAGAAFIAAMIMLYTPVKNMGGTLLNTQLSLLATDRIFNLLDKKPKITDAPDAKEWHDFTQSIQFRNVSFSYSKDRQVLKNINLEIKKGEKIAIVGTSGGGKTTIVNLLPRFYDVKKGAILIDGMDIRQLRMTPLRQNIALVMQDNFLFNGTIYENIVVGNPLATDAEVWEAIEKAYLSDFVNSLDKKLETNVGERGVMLSGGQRQRVAIARAFLKNAPILILDEATSALDNQSEAIVQKALDALMEERTVIMIAHRLSTIKNVDRVLVMEQGKIIEEGNHETLMAHDGVYAHLYNIQFKTTEDAATQTVSPGLTAV